MKQYEILANPFLSLTQSSDYETNQQKQAQTKALEKQINQLVYKLCGLKKEIRIIKALFKFYVKKSYIT